jgi:hypothetical protein
MKRLLNIFSMIALCLIVGACAQPPIPSDSGVSVIEYPDGTKEVNYGPGQYEDSKIQANVEGCRDWLRVDQSKKFEELSTIPESHKSFVLMHMETMSMIKRIFGDGDDPCKPGTNQWDAYIAYVKAHSDEVKTITGGIVKVGTVGIVTYGAVEVTDTIVGAAGATIAGDQINAGNNANKAGGNIDQSGMSAPMSISSSATKSTITQTQVGSDESTIESAEVSNSSDGGKADEEVEEDIPAETTEAAETIGE